MGISLFKRTKLPEPPAPGAVYRRVVAMGVTETAQVLSISSGQSNIPHVRFMVHNDLGRGVAAGDAAGGDLRTLSLDSFRRLFQERVAS